MSDSRLIIEGQQTVETAATDNVKPTEKLVWETPTLEDVSEQVMAQPYIRFT